MSDKDKYVEIQARTRKELEAAFSGSDEKAVCNAMYSAAQWEPDWRWTQAELLKLLNHKSLVIRSTALTALGELALFRGNIDVEVVLPEVHRLLTDAMLGQAAAECLETIKRTISIH